MISALLTAVIPALALPWLLLPLGFKPLFAALPMLPLAWVYARAVRDGRARDAALLAVVWAAALTVSTVAASARAPQAAMQSIWHAGAFRDEMVGWIATGRGAEGDIRLFLPRVLVEYALVWILSALSLGAVALLLGSLLLGYMNGYVGWVVANADPNVPALSTAMVAWPPWSVMRVLSFILAGTAGALWGWGRIYARFMAAEGWWVLLGGGTSFGRSTERIPSRARGEPRCITLSTSSRSQRVQNSQ
jgi:hypothetical protein